MLAFIVYDLQIAAIISKAIVYRWLCITLNLKAENFLFRIDDSNFLIFK